MGKASLDLPDPLKQSGKPAGKSPGAKAAPGDIGLGATDDLLSQLAGNEIDRLLAEAEVEGSSGEVAEAEPTPVAEVKPALSIEPVEETIAPPQEKVAPPENQLVAQEVDLAASPVDTAQGEVGAELDELFAALKDPTLKFQEIGEPEPEPEPEVEVAPVEAAAVKAAPAGEAAAKSVDSSAAVAAELEADERQHRQDKKAEASPAPNASAAVPAAAPAPKPAPAPGVPLWLKPLELINAPFNALPDAWRNALGQIGIVTMLNAVAVLVYVWLFRGKH